MTLIISAVDLANEYHSRDGEEMLVFPEEAHLYYDDCWNGIYYSYSKCANSKGSVPCAECRQLVQCCIKCRL